MSKAEAIVRLAEARFDRQAARVAWNQSGDEIKRLEAALAAAKANNANLRAAYYVAWGEAEAARKNFHKIK
jgi:hypothetical protein